MKKLIIAVLMMLFVTTLHTQWVSNFQPDSNRDLNLSSAKGLSIMVDNYDYCYVTGYVNDGISGNDILTIKYTPQGDTAWVRTFGGSEGVNDQGNGICTDSYGNIYVIGTAANSLTSSDITLLKYNTDGNLEWSRTYYSATQYTDDKGFGIAVDENDNIYIIGYTTNADGYTDMVTQKYDIYGNNLWTALEDGHADLNSKALSLMLDSRGNVCVTGFISAYNGAADIAVLKYDSYGSLIWFRSYNGNGNSEDKAFGIAVDEEDNIIIGGYMTNDNEDCAVLKYDSSGQLVWASSYNGGGNSTDKAFGIAVDEEDGAIFITGYETDLSNTTDYLTMKFNAGGTNEWASTYNGPGNGNDKANSIAFMQVNGAKNIVVTGESMGTENMDYATVQYNTHSGASTKVNRYSMSSTSEDMAQDIATSEDGNIYITGYSEFLTENQANASYVSTIMLNWGKTDETVTNNNPSKYALHQNYPNPFNPSTTIKFDISSASAVKLEVFDMLGRSVGVLVNGNLTAGSYSVPFSNNSLASGVYLYKLTAGDFTQIRKMTLIK